MQDQRDTSSLSEPDPGQLAPSGSTCRTDGTRRRLAGFGLGVPVLMSLASRPVFGANCLSNMMSGNLSDPDRGECELGVSPDSWVQSSEFGPKLTDSIQTLTAEGLELPPAVPSNLSIGAVLNEGGHEAIIAEFPSVTSEELLLAREIINAFFNASLSASGASPSQYVLTPQQVKDLSIDPTGVPPGYGSLTEFLRSTWGT